jgi:hypothetical protein
MMAKRGLISWTSLGDETRLSHLPVSVNFERFKDDPSTWNKVPFINITLDSNIARFWTLFSG